ncbi:hypothetical protein [Nocardia araoensis]|uniref:hypothetical protein n=1 Tax=Nocardia araoensis TaxID=228600 RepID=UPI00030CC95C|nr:hypothetical protein [Nocardia araoensis]
MKFRKLVATTLLTIAATGVTAATAYGQAEVYEPTSGGVDDVVASSVTVAPDRSSATITLDSGTFAVTPDMITVLAPDGEVVATVPTTLRSALGQEVAVYPEMDADATTLTLTPVGAAIPEPGAPQFVGDAGSALGGVLIGCAIGAVVGLIFLIIGVFPGCVLGGLIGGVAGAVR